MSTDNITFFVIVGGIGACIAFSNDVLANTQNNNIKEAGTGLFQNIIAVAVLLAIVMSGSVDFSGLVQAAGNAAGQNFSSPQSQPGQQPQAIIPDGYKLVPIEPSSSSNPALPGGQGNG